MCSEIKSIYVYYVCVFASKTCTTYYYNVFMLHILMLVSTGSKATYSATWGDGASLGDWQWSSSTAHTSEYIALVDQRIRCKLKQHNHRYGCILLFHCACSTLAMWISYFCISVTRILGGILSSSSTLALHLLLLIYHTYYNYYCYLLIDGCKTVNIFIINKIKIVLIYCYFLLLLSFLFSVYYYVWINKWMAIESAKGRYHHMLKSTRFFFLGYIIY